MTQVGSSASRAGETAQASKGAPVGDGRQDSEDEQAGHHDLKRALKRERVPAAQAVGEVGRQADNPGQAERCACVQVFQAPSTLRGMPLSSWAMQMQANTLVLASRMARVLLLAS